MEKPAVEEPSPTEVVDLVESEEDLTRQADETATTTAAAEAAATAAANLRRRSSVGHSIRRSQSTNNGLTFEDQLLVISDNQSMSARDKVAKLVNLSVTATCRSLQKENDQLINLEPGSIDDKRADLVDSMASALGQRDLLFDTHLTELSKVADRLRAAKSATGAGITAPEIMSSRLRQLKNYVHDLKEERDNWSSLRQSRKNRFHLVRSERQAVLRAESCVTSAERDNMSPYEDAWLRGLTDGTGELERMKSQATDLANAQNRVCDKIKQKRKILDELNCELDDMIKRIERSSKRFIVGGEVPAPAPITHNKKIEVIPDTEFGAEVKAWIADMQASS